MNALTMKKRHRKNGFVSALAVFILLLANISYGQTTIEVPLGLQKSPITLTLAPLPASENRTEYNALAERLELNQNDEMITIMVLEMRNSSEISMRTTLADIVTMTGNTRHLFAAYLVEEPVTGRPTYLLPDWKTVIRINPGQELALRLGFILKKGEHAAFEDTLKVYCHFTHAVIQGVSHSISISSRIEPDKSRREGSIETKEDDYGVTQRKPPVGFQLSDKLNKVSVRELRPPTTAISPGGPSVFLEGLIGDLGTDSRLPYWIGIPQAIEEGNFDYHTAMQLMNFVADYRSRFPNKLARTAIWLNQQGILLVPREHGVYMATSVWGVCDLPHDAAEVILYVGNESVKLGIHPTDVAPKPGGYKPDISENPGEVVSFEIECTSGIRIRANRVGNNFDIEVKKDDEVLPMPLTYQRK